MSTDHSRTGAAAGSKSGARSARIVRTFMTHNMADADILSLATGREPELGRILDAVERSQRAAPGTLQHVVLYGNRGFGKSFMTRQVQIEVGKRWPQLPYLLLPEEQHSLQRDPHALLDTIALKLADNRSGGDTAYAEGHFRWPSAEATSKRWAEAETRLEQALDAALPAGGIAIVVVENFDLLLRRLFRADIDEQRLRRWLDRAGNRLMLLATATGTVDMDYDRPLFHAFESVRLQPWSGDDCIRYFHRLRAHQGLAPLSPGQEAKARAVADFIGGTPRLAQLLGEVLDTDDALDVAQIMEALTDRLADYYRRRIEDLAPLSIGLLDALIRGGEPCSQTELAQRVGAGGQSDIARVMSELQQADILRGTPAPDSREKLYRVPDRVFVHYYRLRQGSRSAQDTPLITILDFLRSYYSREEWLSQSRMHLEAGRLAEAGLYSRLAREDVAQGQDPYHQSFGRSIGLYLELVPEAIGTRADEILAQLAGERPEDAYALCQGEAPSARAEAVREVIRAQAVYRLGHPDMAREILEAARLRAESDAVAHYIVLEQLLYLSSRAEAVRLTEVFEHFVGHLPPALEAKRVRYIAWGQAERGECEDATVTAVRAAALASERDDVSGLEFSLRMQAYSLGRLGRHDEAADAVARAAALAAEAGDVRLQAISLRHQALSLIESGRYQEAADTIERARRLAADAGDMRGEAIGLRLRAYSLGRLGRHAEALDTAAHAAAFAARLNDARGEVECICLRAHLLSQIGQHEEAWSEAKRAAGLARRACDSKSFGLALLECAGTAEYLSRPEVVELFDEWLQQSKSTDPASIPDAGLYLGLIFVAVARADAWPALDRLIDAHLVRLQSLTAPFQFMGSGAAFARIAEQRGRAVGYQAMANALPRLATLMQRPQESEPLWLLDIAVGFGQVCRDPGLLRDVADLLTADLAPQAIETGHLLRSLAEVDEAANPEAILARLDPDIAILIRRLRQLPEPNPPGRKERGGKRR